MIESLLDARFPNATQESLIMPLHHYTIMKANPSY